MELDEFSRMRDMEWVLLVLYSKASFLYFHLIGVVRGLKFQRPISVSFTQNWKILLLKFYKKIKFVNIRKFTNYCINFVKSWYLNTAITLYHFLERDLQLLL